MGTTKPEIIEKTWSIGDRFSEWHSDHEATVYTKHGLVLLQIYPPDSTFDGNGLTSLRIVYGGKIRSRQIRRVWSQLYSVTLANRFARDVANT